MNMNEKFEKVKQMNQDYVTQAVAGVIYDTLTYLTFDKGVKLIADTIEEFKTNKNSFNIGRVYTLVKQEANKDIDKSATRYRIEVKDNKIIINDITSFGNKIIIHPLSCCVLQPEDELLIPQLEPILLITQLEKLIHFFDINNGGEGKQLSTDVNSYFSIRGNDLVSKYNHQYRIATMVYQSLRDMNYYPASSYLDIHFPSNGYVATPDKEGSITFVFRTDDARDNTSQHFIMHDSKLSHYTWDNNYDILFTAETALINVETNECRAGEEMISYIKEQLTLLVA